MPTPTKNINAEKIQGNLTLDTISATTISAATYYNAPVTTGVTISNGVVAFNRVDSQSAYTITYSGVNLSVVSDNINKVVTFSASTLPQTNKIYVDSTYGVDIIGNGDILDPFRTVEYALSSTTNTGLFTGSTTSGSTIISGISNTHNTQLKVGQYVTGSGIPYGTIIIAKGNQGLNVNTITLSLTATVTASNVSLTWWDIKLLVLSGNFTATSNWFKPGFWVDAGISNISFDSFTLFSKTSSVLIPEKIKGGNWYGTNINSKFNTSTTGSAHDIEIDIDNYYSIGTGNQFDINSFQSAFRNLYFKCKTFDSRFGRIGYLWGTNNIFIEGDFYGLLYGLYLRSTEVYFFGSIVTPSSITALEVNGKALFNLNVTGQINLNTASGIFNGIVNGTTHTINTSQYIKSLTFNGHILGTTLNINGDGNMKINGTIDCTTTNNTNANINVEIFRGNYVGSGKSKAVLSSMQIPGNFYPFKNITLTTTAEVIINNNPLQDGAIVYGNYPNISISSGCTMTVLGFTYGWITLLSGTLINNGVFNVTTAGAGSGLMTAITGTLENNGTIELVRFGLEGALNTPCINVGSGTYIQNSGKLFCQHSDSKSGLIRKSGVGGKVILKGQPYLRVANGLAPLQILSSGGTTQDILNFGVIDNCAVGFRLADKFTDTTYGTTYTPNILVGGTNYEDTTYLI